MLHRACQTGWGAAAIFEPLLGAKKAPEPRGNVLLLKRSVSGVIVGALATVLSVSPFAARADVAVIRDAETEQLLRDYVTPIFHAAGINTGAARIILIGDKSFNAFVADGQKIFVNVGALMDAKTPNEIIGVLAHESGHIAGGHLARGRQELARAQIMSVAGMLVGAAGAVATGVSARRNNGPVGTDSAGMAGMIMGPQELVRRNLLAYQRTEEQAADRAAVRFLDATHQSSKGLLTTLERFSNDALFQTTQVDPYLQSHPLPAERISNLQQLAKASPYCDAKDSPALQARHDLMRAKLVGFLGDMNEIARRYPLRETSLPARYARAISAYRFGRLQESLGQIEGLIAAEPNNPYFWELKGQVLLESGRAAEALAPLRKATAMAPGAVPIKVLYGHALVATDTPTNTAEAIGVLANATQRDNESAEGFEYLSMAYHRKGETPKAQLAAAQSLFVAGKYVEARTQASRAQAQFKDGTPGWLKADDILNYRPPKSDGIFD
jgi:predicted Zn-dependent protease